MKKNKKAKILFVCGLLVPYIQRDYEILCRHFDVIKVEYGLRFRKFSLWNIVRTFQGIVKAEIAFCWFIGYPAVIMVTLARLLGRKSLVVIGGGELVSVPEINYGFMQSYFLKLITKYVLCLANFVLPVSIFLEKKTLDHISPAKRDRVIRINNGVDFRTFQRRVPKENLVLTTAFLTEQNVIRKGIQIFLESARKMSDTKFVLVCEDRDGSLKKLKRIAPANLIFVENATFQELTGWYDKARVYCQLSLMETFGMALAEAMLFECIPVTTENGALLEVAGKTGFFVPYGDVGKTVAAIRKALTVNTGNVAREHIRTHFSLESREQHLLALFSRVRMISTS